jgi:hypothetical protein
MSTTVTGYDPDIRFYATRYKQGGRTVFSLDLALTQIAGLLPAPDPAHPTEGNRRIKESHARAFGDYVRTQPDWIAPALVLRAPDIFGFEPRESIGGTEFGVISFPRLAGTDLRILDGQHRILGIHMAIQSIANDLEKARGGLAAARRNGGEAAVMQQFQDKIDQFNEQRARFDRERTSLQVFIEDDQVAYKQMFFDIADNALGITSSVRARFDSRKVVNRSLEDAMKHALLKGRVDPEQDRMARNNPNLMGAKHVAEIIRTLAVGIEGRVGRRLEGQLREDALVQKTNDFFDTLIAAFPPLEAIVGDEMAPDELRKTSLLGSTVMLRVLAGVYADLVDRHRFDDGDVIEFFRKLAPHMQGAVTKESIWVAAVKDDVFSPGALAPRSRRQDLKTLRDTMVAWATTDPPRLTDSSQAAALRAKPPRAAPPRDQLWWTDVIPIPARTGHTGGQSHQAGNVADVLAATTEAKNLGVAVARDGKVAVSGGKGSGSGFTPTDNPQGTDNPHGTDNPQGTDNPHGKAWDALLDWGPRHAGKALTIAEWTRGMSDDFGHNWSTGHIQNTLENGVHNSGRTINGVAVQMRRVDGNVLRFAWGLGETAPGEIP